MMDDGQPVPALPVEIEGERRPLVAPGQATAVFFYPKADTPGCTSEAKDFSAALPAFTTAGVAVVGVSRDAGAALAKFAAKHALSVPLAADTDGAVTEAFGVWVEKSMYGKRYMGIERATFLIDPVGRVVRSWRKVKVPGHAAEVLAAAQALAR